jgi:hypothetical protein
MAKKEGAVSKARYREKPCGYCGKPHRNRFVYCSNSCRSKDRVNRRDEPWYPVMTEAISEGLKEKLRREQNENTMYALLNNLKKQKNPHHDPEVQFIIGYNIMDIQTAPGDTMGGDVWQTVENSDDY